MNTLNVCLGHMEFPKQYSQHIDIMLSPKFVCQPGRVAIVPDEMHGTNGSSLSEYAQLFWLSDHIDSIAAGFEFVRIFHYRRFASPVPVQGVPASNNPWSMTIRADQLEACDESFVRYSDKELLNQPVTFEDGALMQYASTHVLADMLNFTKYLTEIGLLSDKEAVGFLNVKTLIPACNIGVFEVRTLKEVLLLLKQAAGFLHSQYFVARAGYQRRTMGFLLERLHSFVLLAHMQTHLNPDMTLNSMGLGYNVIISDAPHVLSTQ